MNEFFIARIEGDNGNELAIINSSSIARISSPVEVIGLKEHDGVRPILGYRFYLTTNDEQVMASWTFKTAESVNSEWVSIAAKLVEQIDGDSVYRALTRINKDEE